MTRTQEKAREIWFHFFQKEVELTGNGNGEHAYQYSLILVNQMLQIHGSSLHQDFWKEVQKELKSF